MATYAQRASSIVGAIINATPTNAQVNRVGVAIASMAGQSDHYAALSDAAKAEFIVRHYRATTIDLVRSSDVQTAMQAAQSSAATDLPEAP